MGRIDNFDGNRPTEYFCNNCGQLRLSLIADKTKCHNCNSSDIVKGDMGSLNKDKLKEGFTNDRSSSQ